MTASAEEHFQAGLALWQAGRKAEAILELQAATQAEPATVLYNANLAAALCGAQQWVEAEAASRRTIKLEPARAESWRGLGNALAGQARWREAADAYVHALQRDPALPRGDAAAAVAWRMAGDAPRAAHHYLRAINDPSARDDAELLTAAAQTLAVLGHVDDAKHLYERVAHLVPGNAAAHNNVGISHQALGEYDEAIACYRRALEFAPAFAACWSNLIVGLNYSPAHTPHDVRSAAEAFARNCAAPLPREGTYANDRNPGRRLRVGYLSPDLHRHAVAYFLLPLLENHTDSVEVHCYNASTVSDDWTAKVRAASSGWVDCASLSDDELAQRIRADGIDILVDLAGHTEGNRLLVFARKPAPVGVNWMGYVVTTGVPGIDWRLTYELTDPAEADADYTERSWRLEGGMWGYRPLPGMPEPTPPPFLRKGCITFGHLNRYSKVSKPALDAWARILSQVPNSRLAIGVPPGRARAELAKFFESRGITANRIDAYDKMEHALFWAMHGEIDIALDPFPFNGGTTSYETLWLGVPLVTCTGEGGGFAPRFSSRMGKAILHTIGLPQLVGSSPEEYVEKAVALARDPMRLITLRQQLRDRMAASPLLDEKLHARSIEAAYRAMWREWCASAAG